jgi:hypothetical protein
VELWSPTERLGAVRSGADGRFAFDHGAAHAAAILVRAVGYGMLRGSATLGDTALVVVLHPLVTTLRPLVASARREACDQAEDPRARALWEAAARRYDLTFLDWAIRDTVLMIAERVSPERLGVVDPELATRGTIEWGGQYHRTLIDRVAKLGYAVRASGIVPAWYDAWEYVPLESTLSGHFADSVFGRLHRFSLARIGVEGVEVRFCPRRRNGPHIDGAVLIGPDTTLVKAEWHFYTTEPDEFAGGEVAFTPIQRDGAGGHLLLPITGLFYRRGVSDFYQVWLDHRRWLVCETDRRERCREVGRP